MPNLILINAFNETDRIRVMQFQDADGSDLPLYTAGAHLDFDLGEAGTRSYSLIDWPSAESTSNTYTIAVQREDEGTGGSKAMHQLEIGQKITATAPSNDFELQSGEDPVLLLAGGIGITPLVSMATELQAKDRPFEFHFSARNEAAMGFHSTLAEHFGDQLKTYLDDSAPLDLAALMANQSTHMQIYICGPRGMIDAAKAEAIAAGLSEDNIHVELFTAAKAQADDTEFEVKIYGTGETFTVPVGKTIIEVLEEAGKDILYDCQRGDCGICRTEVISGEPDHRDVVLSDGDRAGGKLMQICVSRAKSERLVLDIQEASSAQKVVKRRNIMPVSTTRMMMAEDIEAMIEGHQVHRDVYTSREVYQLEMRHLFANSWVFVGHESQTSKEGDYYTTQIGDQPVIQVRHSDGEIKVLHNRCPHKGTKIAIDRDGNTGKFFRCPYHAWAFKTDGCLLAIPLKKGYENTGLDKTENSLGMKAVGEVRNYRGFIFARLADEGISFEDFFQDSLSSLDNMVDRSPEGRLEIAGPPLRYMHQCNWKMLVENQTDTCHPMVAHESSAGTAVRIYEELGNPEPRPPAMEIIAPFMSPYEFFEGMGIRTWPNGHGHTGVSHSIHSDYSAVPGYFEAMTEAYGEERAKEILDENRHNTVYFPSIMIKGPIQQLRNFIPLGPDKTLVESYIYRLVGAPDELLARTAMYNRMINAPTSMVGHDDLEMYERAQEGLLSDGLEWVNLQRLYPDADEDFSEEAIENGTTERQMRNQFDAWKKFMTATMPRRATENAEAAE